MTREQAAQVLTKLADDFEKRELSENGWLERWIETMYIPAHRMGAAALRGHQPDPDTGLVPCGCGGKAKITEQSLNWLIKCVECGIQLEVYGGMGGAVWSWNRAMGWEDKG